MYLCSLTATATAAVPADDHDELHEPQPQVA
jgi:hypothetical protein